MSRAVPHHRSTHARLGAEKRLVHHDATIDSHMHTRSPAQGTSHQPHASNARRKYDKVTPLFTSCVYFLPFYRLALFSGLLFFCVSLSSLLSDTHTAPCIFSARTHTHTHTVPLADGYRTALSLRPWRLFTEENVTTVWKFTGAKKTKDGCARRFCPCLNSAPFPGSLGRYLGVGLRCRQTVTERLCGVTHRALVPPFRCFI